LLLVGRQPKVSSKEAVQTYKELGELTEQEMLMLRDECSKVGRYNYLRNIYGYHAGAIARAAYERWLVKNPAKAS
jgi:hypothetical protein